MSFKKVFVCVFKEMKVQRHFQDLYKAWPLTVVTRLSILDVYGCPVHASWGEDVRGGYAPQAANGGVL